MELSSIFFPKIGGRDFDRLTRAGDCFEDHELDLLEVLVGAGKDDACHALADFIGRWKPSFAGKIFSGRKQPVLGERLDQLRDDRSFEFEMGVPHRMARSVG